MKPIQFTSLFSTRKSVFSLLLALVLLAAFLPQPAQAATCRTYHLVRESDTTPFIAHTYGLKWHEIADANDLKTGVKPEVGQVLCIPTPEEETTGRKVTVRPSTDKNAGIQVSVSGNRIILKLSNFSKEHMYRVKVRDESLAVGGWSKLAVITIEKNKTRTFRYKVPEDLAGVSTLNVCLKDMVTDELTCRTALNP
jgi:LysM repeat protein